MRIFRPLLIFAGAAGLAAIAAAPAPALLLSSNGPPNDRASAPPNYTNCTVCHTTNAVNTGTGSVSFSGVPTEYTPGNVYTITVTVQRTGSSRWGFEAAVFGASNTNIGTSTITDTVRTQKSTASSKSWIKHKDAGTDAGTLDGPVSWSFDWTAPAAGAGTAYFYASGNCANNNDRNTGDWIYNTANASAESGAAHADATLVLQPDSTSFRKGHNVSVRFRVRNHTLSAQSYDVAARVRLPNSTFYPPVGWLLPPVNLSFAAEGFNETTLTHAIPVSAPLLTAVYEGHLMIPGGSDVDTDEFTFSVTP